MNSPARWTASPPSGSRCRRAPTSASIMRRRATPCCASGCRKCSALPAPPPSPKAAARSASSSCPRGTPARRHPVARNLLDQRLPLRSLRHARPLPQARLAGRPAERHPGEAEAAAVSSQRRLPGESIERCPTGSDEGPYREPSRILTLILLYALLPSGLLMTVSSGGMAERPAGDVTSARARGRPGGITTPAPASTRGATLANRPRSAPGPCYGA